MISTALMTATLMLGMMGQYGYGSAPPPNSPQGSMSAGDIDTAPFVQLQRKCFDKAVAEAGTAAVEEKQKRFDTCFALHDAMVKHATAKLDEKEAAGAKRDIDRALNGVEKNYARKLGVVMPGEAK